MRKSIFVLLSLVFFFNFLHSESNYIIRSPNKNISVHINFAPDQSVLYRIEYADTAILQESKLGLIREDNNFSQGLKLDSISCIEVIKDNYQLFKRTCSYTANRRILYFTASPGKKINIIFQVSNDGVAFRYAFPDSSIDIKHIQKEISSFYFFPGTRTWIQPIAEAKSGWCQVNPSYEEHYQQNVEIEKLIINKAGWVFPAVISL